MKLTLNIGKLADGSSWLCLADVDSTDVYPLAQFTSEEHATLFEQFMGTQGYGATKLPTDSEINDLLGDI